MTTRVEYSHYNFGTHRHAGDHPNIYWRTEKVPLYGCTGVDVCLRLYPLGKSAESQGYLSAYVHFYGGHESMSIKGSIVVTVGDTSRSSEIAIGKGTGIPLNKGWGWTKMWTSTELLQNNQVFVAFEVAVLEVVVELVDRTITENPSGRKLYQLRR